MSKKRHLILLIGLCVATAMVMALRIMRYPTRPVQHEASHDALTRTVDRIQTQIASLRDESLEQSLDFLDDLDAYLWPGYAHSALIPVSDSGRIQANRRDMEQIFSSRRFRKCCEELARHPAAAVLVRDRLRQSLTSYSPAYQQFLDRQLQRRVDAGDIVVSIGVNELPLIRLRFKILALCLLASPLRSDELMPELLALAELALAQKKYLDSAPLPDPFSATTHASLYNIVILGTALYGMGLPDLSPEARRELSGKWTERQLVDYSANATEYDPFCVISSMPVVPNKAHITVGCFETLSDREFSSLVEAVRDARR